MSTFKFSSPSEDRFKRPILVCVCRGDHGDVICEVTYEALGHLSTVSPENFADAVSIYGLFAEKIRKLWVTKIIEQGHGLLNSVCLGFREITNR